MRPNAATQRSTSNLYFVYTRRRTSEGDLISGEWRGIKGWQSGLKGPTTLEEAEKIQALLGTEIIPVEVDDFESLIVQAFRKIGQEPPEDLVEEASKDSILDPNATIYQVLRNLVQEGGLDEVRMTLDDVEKDLDERAEKAEDASDTPDVPTPENGQKTVESDQETGEDDDEPEPLDSLEYPGYNKAISLMKDHDFNWKEAGGGRKTTHVEEAWEEFIGTLV